MLPGGWAPFDALHISRGATIEREWEGAWKNNALTTQGVFSGKVALLKRGKMGKRKGGGDLTGFVK